MNFGVIEFPGTTGHKDLKYVIEKMLDQNVGTIWHKDTYINDYDVVLISGGAAFGDGIRPGAEAKHSPIMV